VTDMLIVAARKLGDPISLVVLVVAGDRPFHLHHPTSASRTSTVFVTLLFRLLVWTRRRLSTRSAWRSPSIVLVCHLDIRVLSEP